MLEAESIGGAWGQPDRVLRVLGKLQRQSITNTVLSCWIFDSGFGVKQDCLRVGSSLLLSPKRTSIVSLQPYKPLCENYLQSNRVTGPQAPESSSAFYSRTNFDPPDDEPPPSKLSRLETYVPELIGGPLSERAS